jgi:hypothetical protein
MILSATNAVGDTARELLACPDRCVGQHLKPLAWTG